MKVKQTSVVKNESCVVDESDKRFSSHIFAGQITDALFLFEQHQNKSITGIDKHVVVQTKVYHHFFHAKCLQQWFKTLESKGHDMSCPNCKKVLDPTSEVSYLVGQ